MAHAPSHVELSRLRVILVNYRSIDNIRRQLMSGVLAGTRIVVVDNGSEPAAVSDLASGQVSAMFSSLPSLQGVAERGLVRVIAATAPSKSAATRNLPLMSATLPGFEYTTWYAMYVPLATPAVTVDRINAALRKALQDPAMEAKIEPHGTELIVSSPEEVSALVRRETEKWGRVIREAGIIID